MVPSASYPKGPGATPVGAVPQVVHLGIAHPLGDFFYFLLRAHGLPPGFTTPFSRVQVHRTAFDVFDRNIMSLEEIQQVECCAVIPVQALVAHREHSIGLAGPQHSQQLIVIRTLSSSGTSDVVIHQHSHYVPPAALSQVAAGPFLPVHTVLPTLPVTADTAVDHCPPPHDRCPLLQPIDRVFPLIVLIARLRQVGVGTSDLPHVDLVEQRAHHRRVVGRRRSHGQTGWRGARGGRGHATTVRMLAWCRN
ncbi:hypothetical protein ADK86_23220 [Streptomyces sp. NRRL F-5755]|nr:hypothetical protein ADK86_23220 [Streptomyces sp. NRRL F-5755]